MNAGGRRCGATEALPSDTNSALELRVVDAEGMDQPFTVSQNGTLRTYTGAYDTATLTGDLDTLRYLQDHGAQTIQFVTNGQTSSFAINDLLAQGSGSEVFYLINNGCRTLDHLTGCDQLGGVLVQNMDHGHGRSLPCAFYGERVSRSGCPSGSF